MPTGTSWTTRTGSWITSSRTRVCSTTACAGTAPRSFPRRRRPSPDPIDVGGAHVRVRVADNALPGLGRDGAKGGVVTAAGAVGGRLGRIRPFLCDWLYRRS
ncbi:hypothetical protein ON010_g10881 [Phytophthora cinnamomi]|nr:hypothetical protein ON010_g10881 [Phytophthora cinnamomi]